MRPTFRRPLRPCRFVVIVVPLIAPAAMAQPAPAARDATDAVKNCVSVVHNMAKLGASQYGDGSYALFDAYYNPETKVVHNNAAGIGDGQALFEFQKCMTEQGFPLPDQ